MTPLQRSRRLQAGLACLGIVGALGASFGIGAATHTSSGQAGGAPGPSGASDGASHHRSDDGHEDGDEDGDHGDDNRSSPGSGVTAPQPGPPQATTGGS